jgi:hypothetical protein
MVPSLTNCCGHIQDGTLAHRLAGDVVVVPGERSADGSRAIVGQRRQHAGCQEGLVPDYLAAARSGPSPSWTVSLRVDYVTQPIRLKELHSFGRTWKR